MTLQNFVHPSRVCTNQVGPFEREREREWGKEKVFLYRPKENYGKKWARQAFFTGNFFFSPVCNAEWVVFYGLHFSETFVDCHESEKDALSQLPYNVGPVFLPLKKSTESLHGFCTMTNINKGTKFQRYFIFPANAFWLKQKCSYQTPTWLQFEKMCFRLGYAPSCHFSPNNLASSEFTSLSPMWHSDSKELKSSDNGPKKSFFADKIVSW
jgi:hypothetical protein